MSREDDHRTIFKDLRVFLFGVLYPVTCIICILVFVQRIRRRQRRRYVLLEGQMDPPSEKGGGEKPSSARDEEVAYPELASYGRDPPPSACDILQPLSHLSQLPSSGYLAAVLRRERRNMMEQAYQREDRLHTGFGMPGSLDSSLGDSAPVALGANPTRQNSSLGPEGSPIQAGNQPQCASPPTIWAADSHDQGSRSSLDSGEMPLIQKRSHGVQFMHDVDEEGARTWKRWVVEYS